MNLDQTAPEEASRSEFILHLHNRQLVHQQMRNLATFVFHSMLIELSPFYILRAIGYNYLNNIVFLSLKIDFVFAKSEDPNANYQ